MKNYYQLLGVTENSTNTEIQSAYTNMYHKCLSDKDFDGNVDEKLIDILVAYNALTNNKIKKEYDKVLNSDRPEEPIFQQLQKNTTQPWFKSQLVSMISIIILLAIFTYTLVLLAGFVQTKNNSENVAAVQRETEKATATKLDGKILTNKKYVSAGNKNDIKSSQKNKASKATHDKNKITSEKVNSLPIVQTNIKNGQPVFNAQIKVIKQGSVKGEVLKMRGTPNAIVRFDSETEIWCYTNEKISFTNGIATNIQPN